MCDELREEFESPEEIREAMMSSDMYTHPLVRHVLQGRRSGENSRLAHKDDVVPVAGNAISGLRSTLQDGTGLRDGMPRLPSQLHSEGQTRPCQ